MVKAAVNKSCGEGSCLFLVYVRCACTEVLAKICSSWLSNRCKQCMACGNIYEVLLGFKFDLEAVKIFK